MKLKNILIGAMLSLTLSASAASKSVTIPAAGFTNLLVLGQGGGATLTQIIVTSPTTNATMVQFIDTPTNSLTYSNIPYIQLTSYLTNYITLYTNYWGATNAFTNVAMIDVTNTVAAVTNRYPIVFTGNASTNSSSVYPGPYTFNNGVWATNASLGGSATVTIIYNQ